MQGTGGFPVFQMRVREASDEQKAEQNDGGSGSGYVGERRIKGEMQGFGLSLCVKGGCHGP